MDVQVTVMCTAWFVSHGLQAVAYRCFVGNGDYMLTAWLDIHWLQLCESPNITLQLVYVDLIAEVCTYTHTFTIKLSLFTWSRHRETENSFVLILNLSTRLEASGHRHALAALPQQIKESPQYPLNKRLHRSQSWPGQFWEDRNLLPLTIKCQLLSHPACSLVTRLTELFLLL